MSMPSPRTLNLYFLLSWLLVCVQVASLQGSVSAHEPLTLLWTCATVLSYSFIYLLPALLISKLLQRLLGRSHSRAAAWTVAGSAIGLTALTQVLLFADRIIHTMYGFHINGFVINLLMTPGGIASLGSSQSTELTASAITLALVLLQVLFYVACQYLARRRPQATGRSRWGMVLLAFFVLTVGERIAYGYSALINYQPILFASEHFPLYQPLTFRKLGKQLGIQAAEESRGIAIKDAALSYPLKPLQVQAPEKPLNIVWLVAESLRWDMLDAKIMPHLWDFSNQAVRMEKHFSGGNMTQMGVFSMFYGLYGNYWFPMLQAQQEPLLMQVLREQNYQFSLHTSQRFTYPAFDKTVFARMRAEDMHALENGAPAWQRDVQNIDDILQFIDRRDPQRPFMTYMFFESTHANYNFPEEAAIAKPYLEDFNYLTTDFEKQVPLIKNRYINAAHHVDGQIQRVIQHLKDQQLLDNTVVIVLGDHGEEFMERSRWGHSAEFNRFQTSTPAVLWVPGQQPKVITGISSHMDIPATLMPLLGVQNPAQDYSLGYDLLNPDFHRDYAVAADWNRIAYIGNSLKVTFPVNVIGAARKEVTDGHDYPIEETSELYSSIHSAMLELMGNLKRFSRLQQDTPASTGQVVVVQAGQGDSSVKTN